MRKPETLSGGLDAGFASLPLTASRPAQSSLHLQLLRRPSSTQIILSPGRVSKHQPLICYRVLLEYRRITAQAHSLDPLERNYQPLASYNPALVQTRAHGAALTASFRLICLCYVSIKLFAFKLQSIKTILKLIKSSWKSSFRPEGSISGPKLVRSVIGLWQ